MNDTELRRVDQLAEIINTMKSNIVSVDELKRFAPLFTRPDPNHVISNEDIARLSAEFVAIFDLYRPIEVTQDGQVLFKIPQLFLPISNVKKEYNNLLTEFRNNGSSDIPKYASEATNCALVAILKSQEISSVENGYASFKDMIKIKAEEYQRDIAGFKVDKVATKQAVDQPPTLGDNDGFAWE